MPQQVEAAVADGDKLPSTAQQQQKRPTIIISQPSTSSAHGDAASSAATPSPQRHRMRKNDKDGSSSYSTTSSSTSARRDSDASSSSSAGSSTTGSSTSDQSSSSDSGTPSTSRSSTSDSTTRANSDGIGDGQSKSTYGEDDDDVGNADDVNRDPEADDDDKELLCGFGSCTPRWLQVFHNAKWLLTMLGICAFVQSLVVNSIFPVGLSTLEKRFHMTSTQTGIISSWYDFAVLIAVFPTCHWGNTGHKGRWIGYGTFVMGIGSFVCALPHYIIDPYKIGEGVNTTDYGQCMAERELVVEKCIHRNDDDASYLNPYFLIFLLGQTFHGVGATPLFSIGTAYLDENVSQKASPVYLAIHAVVTSIGPVVGLFIGGFLLTIYDDFDRVDTFVSLFTDVNSFKDIYRIPLVGPADPRWVGAWWLGFLGCAVAALLTAFPILGFARELPEAKRHRIKDVNQVHAVSQVEDGNEILRGNLKNLPQAIWNILRNPTFVTCIVLGIFESIVINGFAAFMPKILETILSTTPTNASYLSSLVIFAAAAGVLIGGVVIRQMNLQVAGMLKMIFVCHVIALVLIICFMIQCPARDFVGITIDYGQSSTNGGLLSASMGSASVTTGGGSSSADNSPLYATCNTDCHCTEKWNPVCDTLTQQTYFSACFAGCARKRTTADFWTVWDDCRCATMTDTGVVDAEDAAALLLDNVTFASMSAEASTSVSTVAASMTARMVGGFCTKECGLPMWVFLTLLFFSVVASFASGIPSQQIMLRVIPFQQRTLGIGVHWTFLRLLGFIPGGVLFGLIIDTTCLKWQVSACGNRQSCLVHDPYKLSWTIMAVSVVCKLVSILTTIIGYLTYQPTDLDNALSIQTVDSRGPLSLTVNDDRVAVPTKNGTSRSAVENGVTYYGGGITSLSPGITAVNNGGGGVGESNGSYYTRTTIPPAYDMR